MSRVVATFTWEESNPVSISTLRELNQNEKKIIIKDKCFFDMSMNLIDCWLFFFSTSLVSLTFFVRDWNSGSYMYVICGGGCSLTLNFRMKK